MTTSRFSTRRSAGVSWSGFFPLGHYYVYRWLWSVVTRYEEQKDFVVLPKRWLIERTFGWFNWCRRLSCILRNFA